MSKGSSRRPAAVPPQTVDANYERTFQGAAMTLDGRCLWCGQDTGAGYFPDEYVSAHRCTPSGRADAEG